MLEGIVSSGSVGTTRPGAARRDPVTSNERPLAARQIHRSIKAWRDREAENTETEHESKEPGDAPGALQEADAKTEEGKQDGEDNVLRQVHRSPAGDGETIFRMAKATQRVKVRPTGTAPVLGDPEMQYEREVAIAIDKAQTTMNDLYRKRAEYGDGSTAYLALYTRARGKDPTGANHVQKAGEYIAGLTNIKASAALPTRALEHIDRELIKLQDALGWKPGDSLPRWARAYSKDLGV